VLSRFFPRLIFLCVFVLAFSCFGQGGGVEWESQLLPALARSMREKKPVLVSIHSASSPGCKLIDEKVYADPEVIAELSKWILVRIDFDRNQLFCKQHMITQAPSILLSRAASNELIYPAMILMGDDNKPVTSNLPLEATAFVRWIKDFIK
jgi:hypothetical protein